MASVSPKFAGQSQEDSQEFLTVLLDLLHEDLKKIAGPISQPILHNSVSQRISNSCEPNQHAQLLYREILKQLGQSKITQ